MGITPACAGTTGNIYSCGCCVWDHPRMCGDHASIAILLSVVSGSPPHVRGPHDVKFNALIETGITPACAGTTLSMCSSTR